MMNSLHGGFVCVLIEVVSSLVVLIKDKKHRLSITMKSDIDYLRKA